MGPFSFVPLMECYHGILSMNHSLKGTLSFQGENLLFTGGKGYIEKDWGHSFEYLNFYKTLTNMKNVNNYIQKSSNEIILNFC